MTATTTYHKEMAEHFLARYGEADWHIMSEFVPDAPFAPEEWSDLMKQPFHYISEVFKQAGCNEIKGIPAIGLKQIFSEHIGQRIVVEGKAVAISDHEIIPTIIAYRCLNCDEVLQQEPEEKPPYKCPKCSQKGFEEDNTNSQYEDIQFVKIHELKPANNQIAKLTIKLSGKDVIWKVRAGQKIRSIGIFNIYKDKFGYKKRLEAEQIEPLDSRDAEYLVTQQDIERFRNELNEPQFYEKVRASFAPFIHGMDEVKDASIIMLASIKTARPLNLLLVGDPAKAKSVLLEYMASLTPNGQFASAASTTWAGLSVTSEKDHDTESWILKYGALALADEDVFCLDEFQNMSETDIMKMNEVLESKKISYAKAGGNSGEVPTRCAVVIACNPHFGKWMKKTNIQENLKFMGRARDAFISRMALIFILPDEAEEVLDKQIAEAILKHSADNAMKKYFEDWTQDGIDYFGFKTLKKFFSWITSQPVPEVPETLYPELIEFYSKERNDIDNKLSGLITPRYLKDAIRLAQMKARVLGKNEVDRSDVDFAIDLLNKSLNESAFDPKTGKIDGNIVTGSKAESAIEKKESKETQFWEAFNSCLIGRDFAPTADWIKMLVDTKNWKKEEAEKWIQQAENKGKIYGAGNWKRI